MSLTRLKDFLAEEDLLLRLLDDDHYIDWFDCGDEEMNAWLAGRAHKWQAENLSRVWVLTDSAKDPDAAIGFFTLSSHQVTPASIAKPHRAQDESNKEWINNLKAAFPATLLGKFALAQERQKEGLSRTLMLCAYVHHLEAASHAGSKFLVLDVRDPSLDEYYKEKFGFFSVLSEGSRIIKATTVIEEEVRQILK